MDTEQSQPVALFHGDGPAWTTGHHRRAWLEDLVMEVSAWLVKLCALVVIAGISVMIWGLSQGDRE